MSDQLHTLLGGPRPQPAMHRYRCSRPAPALEEACPRWQACGPVSSGPQGSVIPSSSHPVPGSSKYSLTPCPEVGRESVGKSHLRKGSSGSTFPEAVPRGCPVSCLRRVSGLFMHICSSSPPCAFTCCVLQTRGSTQAETTQAGDSQG